MIACGSTKHRWKNWATAEYFSSESPLLIHNIKLILINKEIETWIKWYILWSENYSNLLYKLELIFIRPRRSNIKWYEMLPCKVVCYSCIWAVRVSLNSVLLSLSWWTWFCYIQSNIHLPTDICTLVYPITLWCCVEIMLQWARGIVAHQKRILSKSPHPMSDTAKCKRTQVSQYSDKMLSNFARNVLAIAYFPLPIRYRSRKTE